MKHIRIFETFKETLPEDEVEEGQPWYEPEDCEDCLAEAEESGIEYERNFTWKDGTWICDSCGGYC